MRPHATMLAMSIEARETDEDLAIKCRFDLDSEFGRLACRNTKGRSRVSGLSMGYAIRNSTKTAAGNELTELVDRGTTL